MILLSVIALMLFFNTMVINLDAYPEEYKKILKRTEYCIQYSDTVVIAEYVSKEDKNYYRFKTSECVLGNIKQNEELLINIPEADSVTIRDSEIDYFNESRVPYTEYMDEYWYIDNLLVDLIPGEKYLILGEELYPYKGVKRIKQFVMHYEDFSAKDIQKQNIENSETYLSLFEYIKYIDRKYGHGTKEG